MFNWFKSKIELKNEDSIMSSFYNPKGVKIGSEITVPQNFEGLIFNNGKHYMSLSSGKYKMDKDTFADLIKHQQKQKSKLKHIKFVCHYITTCKKQMEISFKKSKFLVEFHINNTITFANFLLLYNYKVDDDYVYHTLYDVFVELLLFKLGDYNKIEKDDLNAYGITINSFSPLNKKVSIFSNKTSNDNNLENKPSLVDNVNSSNNQQPNNTTNIATPSAVSPQNNPIDTALHDNKQQNISTPTQVAPQFPVCPKCNHSAKFNTTYCLRCGYKLQ